MNITVQSATSRGIIIITLLLFVSTILHAQPTTICNPLQVKKCALPFGSFAMTSAELLDMVHEQTAVVGKVRIQVDSIYGVTNATGKPSETIVQRTIRFADVQTEYTYVFTKNGAQLETVTYASKLANAASATSAANEFNTATKLVATSVSTNKKGNTYSTKCDNGTITICIAKSDATKVVVSYSWSLIK